MKQLATALAAISLLALTTPTTPAAAASESIEAQMAATDAAMSAQMDMMDTFGTDTVAPGKYLWRDIPASAGPERVIVSLSDQLAYLYRGNQLMAVASVSSGRPGHDTPTGQFEILNKETMHRSNKYENAPMPFAQFFTDYGVALHAGYNPGEPASHGCIRLPKAFAKKLFTVTNVGTPVLVGA
jgi:lipoprotein-anchoring transpeptidase ErfK/SrfK